MSRRADGDTYCGYTLSFALFACINRHKMYLVALFTLGPPVYSWKYRSSGTLELIGALTKGRKWCLLLTLRSLCRKMSILFKNKIIDVLRNHRELITESKRTRDSAIRF